MPTTCAPANRITLRRRADLVVSLQIQNGQKVYVLKDPLSLKYYRLDDYEYAILQRLDGQASVNDVTDSVNAEFPQLCLSEDDVRAFVTSLYQNALVIGDRPGQGQQLKQRRDRAGQQRRWSLLRNVLAIRCPGVDPTWLLDTIYPWTGWFFSRRSILVVIMLAIVALAILAGNSAEVPSELVAMHQYFGPGNWLLLAITLAVTKILHELGHALACRRCGGECHEIGVMLLVLTPCLYCDVSDSWLLSNRWHRAAIAAAGMYVEVALASLATLIWAHTDPGTVHFLALQVMLICGLSTVLFNGNPLARYDGYYILADIVDIPNLRDEARAALSSIVWQKLFGVQRPTAARRPSWKLALFGLGVICYRWILLSCILWFLYQVLAARGLEVAWQYLAGTTIFAAAIFPAWRFIRQLFSTEVWQQMQQRRILTLTSAVVMVIAAVLFVPLPCYVYSPLELRVADASAVYAPQATRLAKLRVKPGQRVDAGQSIASLHSVDLQLAVARLKSTVRSQEMLLGSLKYERYENPQAAAAVPQAEELLHASEQQLAERQRDLAQLHLQAPTAGVVLVPQRRRSLSDESTLDFWSGSPLDGKNAGVVLAQGDVICEIGDPQQLEAVLVVDQANVEQLRQGQTVQVVLEAQPWHRLRGQVHEIARQKIDATPESLSVQAGGSIASRIDQRGIQCPISASYTVRVPLDAPSCNLMAGMRGSAKIRTGWKTLATRGREFICRTFHFGL